MPPYLFFKEHCVHRPPPSLRLEVSCNYITGIDLSNCCLCRISSLDCTHTHASSRLFTAAAETEVKYRAITPRPLDQAANQSSTERTAEVMLRFMPHTTFAYNNNTKGTVPF